MIYSLDLETAPADPTEVKPYALEPFRYAQGLAIITSCSIAGPNGSVVQHTYNGNKLEFENTLSELLRQLAGHEVVAHNALFDVAWLIAATSLEEVSKIKWRDTMLQSKWINNGQQAEMPKKSYSLANLVTENLKGHDLFDEFLDVKSKDEIAGINKDYWDRRGRLDAILTRDLYLHAIATMPERMINGYLIEQRTIVPVANSWLVGISLNKKKAKNLIPKIETAKSQIISTLDIPGSAITSPKQLSTYLFDKLGLIPISMTPTGKPSTKSDDLKKLRQAAAGTMQGELLQKILDYKHLSTLKTKFIDGIIKTCDYVGEDVNHSAPRIFGTYTGRYTYSSKTKSIKFKPGIATHQLPRKGPTRGLLGPVKGTMIGELDAAAQEMRGMAIVSGEPKLIDGFNDGLDLHGGMGAEIANESYEDFIRDYKAECPTAQNYRYAGKLLNLSCQYRIGANALKDKFFSTYGIIISSAQAYNYLAAYKRRYPGVQQYWSDAIYKAKASGYAETVAGRRFYLDMWSSHKWMTESSAINFPVQGFGAEHKSLAIGACYEKYPEAVFSLDLHDGLWYSLPDDHGAELLLDMRDYISTLPYAEIWGLDLPVDLPFDAQLGTTFGNIKEIQR